MRIRGRIGPFGRIDHSFCVATISEMTEEKKDFFSRIRQ
jgi:hypothetical protein